MSLSPNIISFLPMLYVAWADEVLTEDEINVIKDKIDRQNWLNQEEKAQLSAWLNPVHSPSAREMQRWLKHMEVNAANFSGKEKLSLVQLGQEMASLEANGHEPGCKSEEAHKALNEIEEVLGVVSHEASRELMRQHQKEEPESLGAHPPILFDPKELQAYLEPTEQEIRNRVRNLIKDPSFALQIMPDKSEYREQVLKWTKAIADQGWGGISYPEIAGGKGDMRAYIAVFETIGYHDLSLLIKMGVQFGLWGGSVMNLGTEKHHKKYLKAVGSMALPGCFAMTEEGHGSNVRDIETVAVYNPDRETFTVNTPNGLAHKVYIGNAAEHGLMATVFAQLETLEEEHGVHAFVVELRDIDGNLKPGIRIEDCGEKLGLNGVDNGRIWFDQVEIPRENLLDRFATVDKDGTYSSPIANPSRRFFTMLGTLVGGRVCVPMGGLSAAKKGLTMAIRYALQRRQFGRDGEAETLIMQYQTHQMRLLPLLAKSFALHFAHQYMVERYVNSTEEDSRELEALAAGLKSVSTWHTTETLQTCREGCGGNGYLAENLFASLKADTDIFTTFEGDNTVLLQLVAKARLSNFSRQFHEHKVWGLVRFMAKEAAVSLSELNPITVRKTGKDHLLDPEFHLAAFRYRENRSVRTVANRLKSRIDDGVDSYDAMIQCQQHLVDMATYYIERVILEQFQKALDTCNNEQVRAVLTQVYNLYVLSSFDRDKAYWLEAGYMEGNKTKAIRRLMLEISQEMLPNLTALTDSFGIPEACMPAPMLRPERWG